MKTAEEVLEETISESPYNINFKISKPYIVRAMNKFSLLHLKELTKETESEPAEFYIEQAVKLKLSKMPEYTSRTIQEIVDELKSIT